MTNTAVLIISVSFFCAAALAFAVTCIYKSRKQTGQIKLMLDAAKEGNFRERRFDESTLSQLESAFADYLNSNEVSQGKLSEEKDKIKTLISDISHQTKTPIANLRLYSDLLREAESSGDFGEYVEQIGRQTEKLQFLVDTLVKLSRLETGILRLQPEPGSLPKLLQQIEKDYAPRAAEKGLELSVAPVKDIKAVFDEKWTYEAVSNIVDNAIKYSRKGSIILSLRSFDLFSCIDISDNGIGIPESEQASVFRRFSRGKNVNRQDGVGIGLFLARELISGQDGYIKLKSDEKGSTFSVFLPAVK